MTSAPTTPLTKEERDALWLREELTDSDVILDLRESHDAADALLLQKDALLQAAIEALEPFAKIISRRLNDIEGEYKYALAEVADLRRAARAHAMLTKGE